MDKLKVLIEKFIEASIIHGEESWNGNYKEGNKQYKIKTKCFEKIKTFANDWQNEILKLLNHENGYVRVSAAYRTLSFNPDEAVKTLKALLNEPKGVGFDAKMLLSEWEKGNLKF